jgi:hypothetical protein
VSNTNEYIKYISSGSKVFDPQVLLNYVKSVKQNQAHWQNVIVKKNLSFFGFSAVMIGFAFVALFLAVFYQRLTCILAK